MSLYLFLNRIFMSKLFTSKKPEICHLGKTPLTVYHQRSDPFHAKRTKIKLVLNSYFAECMHCNSHWDFNFVYISNLLAFILLSNYNGSLKDVFFIIKKLPTCCFIFFASSMIVIGEKSMSTGGKTLNKHQARMRCVC